MGRQGVHLPLRRATGRDGRGRSPGDEQRRRVWERAAIAIPWLLSILAFGAGIIEFSMQQQAANRRPFLEKQLAVTFEAADLAAVLATTDDLDAWRAARRNFRRLKFGQLRIVEDRELSLAMSEFWKRVPSEKDEGFSLPMRHLEYGALIIAQRSRVLIGRSWNVDLEPLIEAPPSQSE